MFTRRLVLAGLATSPLFADPVSAACNAKGKFEGRVVAEWLSEGRNMRLTEKFAYVDSCGKRWAVPAGATVNGASIPSFLWTALGSPFTGQYRDASVIHDWYCAVRTEPNLAVHRMFYDAMITSGLGIASAKIMYIGVRLGGPTWDDLTVANARLAMMNDQIENYRLQATGPASPSSDGGGVMTPSFEEALAMSGIDQASYYALANFEKADALRYATASQLGNDLVSVDVDDAAFENAIEAQRIRLPT